MATPPYEPDFTPRNLVGTDGNDILIGAYGNDTLQGGLGSDSMEGDMGNDTYVVRLSDEGQDTIGANFSDVIDIQDQVNLSDLSLRFDGAQSTLYVGLMGPEGQPQLVDDLVVRVGTMGYPEAGVTVRTGTGQTARLSDLLSTLTVTTWGTEGNDSLVGFAGRDAIRGGAGNDGLDGRDGDDTLMGEAGNDDLKAGLGNNLLDGGTGNDSLWGDMGNDTLLGGDGDDLLFAGGGNDSLAGGAGSDFFFVDGVTSQQAWVDADGNDFIYVPGSVSQLMVGKLGEFGADTVALRSSGASSFLLVLQNATRLQGLYIVDGNNGVMAGSTVSARAQGLSEAAILVNSSGNSGTLNGGPGNEELVGALNNDLLRAGGGNDTLYGSRGNDTLVAGGGSDLLIGGADADTYVIAAGDVGAQIVADGQDTVKLAFTKSQMAIQRQAADGSVTVTFGGTATAPAASFKVAAPTGIDSFKLQFTDGSATWADVMAVATGPVTPPQSGNLTLTGNAGADTLTGGAGNDTLTGLAGNDSLNGGAGNDSLNGGLGADTLQGGVGNDTLVGDKGNDTYLFGRGDGRDLIVDKDSTLFNADLLKFSGATSKQLWFTRSGNNLDVAIIGTPDKVSIQDWFVSSANRVEKFTAGDGKSLSAARVSALVSAMSSFTNQAMAGTDLGSNVPATVTKLIASSWA